MRVGITFGTFDLLHIGHINILERAKAVCDYLVVGVSTDALTIAKKGVPPVYPEAERIRIVSSLRVVDFTFPEESLEAKADYIKRFHADVLVMGQDWEGKFDHLNELCEVLYLPRTPNISTTEVRAEIFSRPA
ncbi:MAG TPA: adenylyltransferase/cytidyltransferase family protein [Candidatus Limnocylindria bacterium]|jgi:glycerol-3-phosphate cytidylyltransferase